MVFWKVERWTERLRDVGFSASPETAGGLRPILYCGSHGATWITRLYVLRSPLPATARTIDENDACFIIRDVRRCPLNVSRRCHQSCVFCHLPEHHRFFSTLHLDYNERRPPANHTLPLNPHVLRNPSV